MRRWMRMRMSSRPNTPLALLRIALAISVMTLAWTTHAAPQPPPPSQSAPGQPPPRRNPEDLERMSASAEKAGLSEPFKGITANGQIEPGLFAVRSTGVTTAPVREAAVAFLAALTPEQRERTEFAVDDDEWRKWMNQ